MKIYDLVGYHVSLVGRDESRPVPDHFLNLHNCAATALASSPLFSPSAVGVTL